jgi:pimeloyl-ACP methyl ester carboxylesterase
LVYARVMTASAGRLHVEDSVTGAPVVLLHSSGMSGRQWRRLAKSLVARGMRARVPDLAGHGESPAWPEPTPFTFRFDVERVAQLLGSLGSPGHVVGHSYGGLIALLASLAAPSSVRSLALYDPVAFGVLERPLDADVASDLERVPQTWDVCGRERWLEAFVDYWGGPGAWPALRDDVRAEFRRVAWVVYQGVTTLLGEETPASAYRDLRVPLLLLTGSQSPIAAQKVVLRLAGSFPRARVVTVPEAGHMGPLTHADFVNETILGELSGHAGG